MKVEVNDYVRTKDGRIFRWSSLCTTDIEDYMEHTRKILFIEDEIKSSPNIIDLIEVGDYVNGKHVDKYQGKLGVFCELPNGKWEFIELTNEHYLISSIVTKEQFSCMEYKIGE